MKDLVADKTVYLVRHGQCTSNMRDVFQGPDDPLTELGVKQAQYVAERCRDLHVDAFLTSPMPRTVETAQMIGAAIGQEAVQLDLLREYVPPSTLIGKERTSDEGRAYIREMLENLDNPDWHHSDEDNYHDLHNRVVKFIKHLEDRPERNILAVTHAGFVRAMMTAMMTEGEPNGSITRMLLRFLKPMNTGVTICEHYPDAVRRNKWRLVVWNDHGHLAETTQEEPA